MRIEFIYLEGKKYPLSFSLAASEKLAQKHNDFSSFSKILKDKKVPINKKMDCLCDILASLIYSGCQYYNAFNIEPYKDAPFVNGRYHYISSEQLKTVINPSDLSEILDKISKSIENSNKKKIGTKPSEINSKKKQNKKARR